MYNSVTHDLYIVLCALHPKSGHLLSPCIWPPLPFTTSHPLPSGKYNTVLCVYEFLFVCFYCTFVNFKKYYCIFSIAIEPIYAPCNHPTYEWNLWFLTFFIWLISLSMIFSRTRRLRKDFWPTPNCLKEVKIEGLFWEELSPQKTIV